jgi:ATP-dependent Clp protease ATP-binding subunit ClpC
MRRLRDQMGEHAADVSLTEEAKDLLVEKGYDPTMGARPLRRAIQRYIEDPLADFVLGRELTPGSTILVDKKRDSDDEVEIEIIPGAPPENMDKITVPPDEPGSEGGADDSEQEPAE